MTGLVLFLAIASVYRLTMLVTNDEITAPARDAALRWMGERRHRKVEEVTVQSSQRKKRWQKARCACGFQAWRYEGDTTIWVNGPGLAHPVRWSVNDDDMGVLAVLNGHLNSADHQPRFDRLPILLTCPWCASMHVAPIVVASALRYGGDRWWQLVAGALTASAVTGIASHVATP